MKDIAIILARGGSKRIPRKNIKPFMGRPVIAYSIEATLQSGLFGEVMVSTDDEEIAGVARRCGARVPFMRSAEAANDYATTADVISEVLDAYKQRGAEFRNVCCIYATAPFVTAGRLAEACRLLDSGGYDSVFTAVAFSYPVWRGLEMAGDRIRMIWPEYRASRSQDLKPVYHDAGQFYLSSVTAFSRAGGFWGRIQAPSFCPSWKCRTWTPKPTGSWRR